jgi:hypothetical protein
MMKCKQKISGCFRSYAHALNFANIRSVLSSILHDKTNNLRLHFVARTFYFRRHALFNMLFSDWGICHQIALLVFDALLHQPIDLCAAFQDGGCQEYFESAAHGKILVTTIIELLAISCVQCKHTQTTRQRLFEFCELCLSRNSSISLNSPLRLPSSGWQAHKSTAAADGVLAPK